MMKCKLQCVKRLVEGLGLGTTWPIGGWRRQWMLLCLTLAWPCCCSRFKQPQSCTQQMHGGPYDVSKSFDQGLLCSSTQWSCDPACCSCMMLLQVVVDTSKLTPFDILIPDEELAPEEAQQVRMHSLNAHSTYWPSITQCPRC